MAKVRYADVRVGCIAQEAVLSGFKNVATISELAALVTNDPEKARTVATQYKAYQKVSYEGYDELLRSGSTAASQAEQDCQQSRTRNNPW